MCIPIKPSSSSRALNPRAKEWYPAPKGHSYPPPVPVQMVAVAPHYFRGFIPYGIRLPVPLTTCALPALHEAAPPTKVVEPNRRINIPVCDVPKQSFEWRPKKSGTATTTAPSPPRAASPPSVKRSSPSKTPKTTLYIRNIPNQLSRDFMVGFLDSYCQSHSLEYDFLYLPMDFCKEKNLGFAFVNLTSVGGAIKLRRLLQNYKWGVINGTYTSKKVCDIKWAITQGMVGQIRRFEKSVFECEKEEFLPVVFNPPRNGWNGDVSSMATLGVLRNTL